MTKKHKKIDRSRLVPGPLADETYRKIVGLKSPADRGIINPPKPEREGGHWRGNTWFPDRVEDPSLVGMLSNYHHLESGARLKLLKRVSENLRAENNEILFEPDTELSKAIAEARDKWLFPGRFPMNEIVAEAREKILGVSEDGGPIGKSTNDYYLGQDKLERIATYGTDTKSDVVIDRRNRLRRIFGV